uniref:Uncharacterized protein n=1 Tax=Hyaloperonospora arabidopsidis (strain Emoy2) TaxID=559515 RepID=M4BSH7_HYAAE
MRCVGWSKHPPSISYLSSLKTSSTQLYIKSAFESFSVIPFITRTKKHCVCVRVIGMRHDTQLTIEFSAAWKAFWRREKY